MPTLHIYPPDQLPAPMHWQILGFMRTEWWQGFTNDNRWRDWITRPEFHPVYFVLAEGDYVISHAQVCWKDHEHAGQTYKMYGLSGVFTFPQFRREGYAQQVIRACNDYIAQQGDADLGLLHCDHANISLYRKCGWDYLPSGITWLYSRTRPVLHEEAVMMRFWSPKGHAGRRDFETQPIFFDDYPW